ncbi:MAG TPA: DNA-processing protein DprA [Candidatus Babeliales bacterium]|jgi:DNA processing protein|nr:DNA-processing protein DprA [Candidatus Babeliales bacterium]
MNNKNFILHLTLIETIGPAAIQKIIRSDISISDLYSFSSADWMRSFGFSDATASKLVTGLADKKIIDEEIDLIARHNVQWVTVEDEMYPELLREIYLPPAVIYFMGASLDDSKRVLSVVGARKADGYGERVVNAIVPDLVTAGYTIVSGGAQGIDTMVHAVTLKSGGKTVAVLGSGLLRPYPSSNEKLFRSIVESGGSVVSPFCLRMEPMQGNFPARNRIITGLSRGCLVVQAAKKSGALISAHYAMEQGREVFAVPGFIDDELSVGCNTLIQQGAKLVMNAADILEEFGDRMLLPDLRSFSEVGFDKKVIQEKALQLSLETAVVPAEKMVDKYVHYSAQQRLIIAACKQSSSFDSIINITQLTSETVQSELFNLQLDGIVSQDFTGMWVACK